MKLIVFILATACSLRAGDTLHWIQDSASDFEKGRLHGVALRSDGHLSPSPAVTELFDASTAYLWAIARDSKGNLYTGGGPGAKLFQISPDGTHRKLAEFEGLEIHAIAIDGRDQVYAATSPDGKIYRVRSDGKSDVFYDPKQKYIWGMAFGPQGDLFVATGDQGQIHRVDPNGKGQLFFKTGETHARSIAIDAQGNVIAGTAPGGLVFRVSPAGTGFVLYQLVKHEITAVAAAPDGSVYAAGLAGGAAIPPPVPLAIQAAPARPGGEAVPEQPAPRPIVSGGADVYRIEPSGAPEKVWSNPRDTVYSIAFDRQGRAILGAGNRGTLYRIDSSTLSTALLNVASTQITSLVAAPGGAFYAAAGNTGKVFQFGPESEARGSIESEVFDAKVFSQWGFVKGEGSGKFELSTRTGNVDRPQENWSGWMPVNGRATSPPARFFQWKAVLAAGAELESVDTAYLPKNVPPRITSIESTPPNYRFAPPSAAQPGSAPAPTVNLPALGEKRVSTPRVSSEAGGASMTFEKGWIGARWNATDENGDALIFAIEIRGEDEKQWRPLASKIPEKHFSFDSTGFPDGRYRFRITASDLPTNAPAEALSSQEISEPFLIDNTPPEISALAAKRQGKALRATWKATDAWSVIERAEYSLDGQEWTLAEPTAKLSDALSLDYELLLPDVPPGEHILAIRVRDAYRNQSISKVIAN